MEIKRNITPGIQDKLGRNLHNRKNHPLEIIKRKIYNYFGSTFEKFDDFNPIVKIEENFDKLLIPKDHPARGLSDTYYQDEHHVLRTHTSAHQNTLLNAGHEKFLVTGDVYRKDDIDSCHYPVFHQMEGVCIVGPDQDPATELKAILSGLVNHLFPNCEYHFKEDYFPFTEPSYEVEVLYNGNWLEILGCGVVHTQIMQNCNLGHRKAYAFGLGIERLAMILFNIPDIRYFWSDDARFISQFESGEVVEFKPYSPFPSTDRDISFWLSETFTHNDFCSIIRELGGDIIESVSKVGDDFIHPKTSRVSRLYRIVYRSNDRSLTNDEVNVIQEGIISAVKQEFNIEIR